MKGCRNGRSRTKAMRTLSTRVEEVVSLKEFESDFYGVQLGMVVVSNCAFIVSQILWLQSLLL